MRKIIDISRADFAEVVCFSGASLIRLNLTEVLLGNDFLTDERCCIVPTYPEHCVEDIAVSVVTSNPVRVNDSTASSGFCCS